MDLFPKINSIYKRDERGAFIVGDYAVPEVEYLATCQWSWTEKVDGTNIRIGLEQDEGKPAGILVYRIGGRTERANIPATLLDGIRSLGLERKMREKFGGPVTLYGEGYGAKIQKGGGNYRPDQSFVLFDVKVGPWWLRREDVVDVAGALGIDVVPEVLVGTIADALALVDRPEGVTSSWGPFRAEGLVGRPTARLFDSKGNRILVKLKSVDFDKVRRVA